MIRRVPEGLRYMAAGAFFFSLMSAAVKLAGRGLPTQEIVLARSVVVVGLSWAALRRRRAPMGGHRRGLLVVRGLLGFTALSCFYYAVIHLPLADATVIQYTNPVFTALIAAVTISEGIRLREIGLAMVSLVGVVLVARPGFLFASTAESLDPVAVTVAVAGAVFSAGAYVTVRRLGATEDAMVIVLYFAAISTLGSLPVVIPTWVTPTPVEWLLLACVGVTTQLGQVFMTRGLERERAGRATAVGYLQIVFAALWGILFFSEIPDGWSLLGGGLIVGSTLLVATVGGRGGGDEG